ncbi:methyl farnesoate epoxidase-like isoform X1 [Apis cerana]|uniref:methyl farnesoate epoxidase-like isoform X1 n=2 Tax=Apis cerana TaxID=7461 RepID=UPI0007E2AD07|nr:methyl farnesoate epoxidase-like isoform X1 [Apis cerana]XP_028523353.1 methyl farnesoate epoxidase-like isoform X1 [Apis cerana]
MWFVILCFVIALIKILFDYSRPINFPPGPRGLPFIGNILDIIRLINETKYYSDTWCRLAEKYGSVVGLKLGFDQPLIIVSGKSAVTEMLNRSEFDGRPSGFLYKYRCGGMQQGILFTDTDVWHSQRRFALKTLKQFGFGKNSMEHILQHDAIALTNIIIELTKDGTIKNIRSIISAAVLSNLWLLIDGTKFDVGMENSNLKEAINIVQDIVKSSNVSGGIINQFPFLRYLFPNLTGFSAFVERQKRINNFFMEVIAKHKWKKINEECTNFIDVYLQEIQKKNSSHSFFNENQLLYIIKDLFSAGVDTTNSTIGFIIAFLVVHQDVQSKVYDEISRVIDKDIYPSLSDKDRLPYLKAVIAEVSRLANIGPTSIPHRAVKDSTFLGFEIKKNYTLLANFKSIHMDKEHWGDPEIFRPERFINEKGDFINDSWLMPFGLGRRKCLGETLAKNTVFLFVACMLQRLHFMLPSNHPPPCLQGIDGFVIAPPIMDIIAVQRF